MGAGGVRSPGAPHSGQGWLIKIQADGHFFEECLTAIVVLLPPGCSHSEAKRPQHAMSPGSGGVVGRHSGWSSLAVCIITLLSARPSWQVHSLLLGLFISTSHSSYSLREYVAYALTVDLYMHWAGAKNRNFDTAKDCHCAAVHILKSTFSIRMMMPFH